MSEEPILCAGGWEQNYVEGRTPWDLGAAPPVLVDLVAGFAPSGQRVFVPGAGYGHDAFAWASAGHRVTAVDVAPTAVREARRLAAERGLVLDVVRADLFDLPARFAEAFDVVWEQTCFCALPVDRRPDYVRAVASVLVDGGSYLGLFWNCGRRDGPPHDVTPEQVRESFGAAFEIEALDPVTGSVAGRASEFLARMCKTRQRRA